MREWKKVLTEGEQNVMQEIVDQIPTTMGIRERIEDILDKMAQGGQAATPSKFKFLVVSNGDVQGTNDREKAEELAADEDNYVLLVPECKWLVDEDTEDEITELK